MSEDAEAEVIASCAGTRNALNASGANEMSTSDRTIKVNIHLIRISIRHLTFQIDFVFHEIAQGKIGKVCAMYLVTCVQQPIHLASPLHQFILVML
ncbi:hypothetical protein M8J76_001567 [Diaphorina citri]|nr:hypothetical protein M8J75_001765 [Diaphorina citri]KAI5740203.1 hypothetical protein M8J76_001567 [Diaphorina citri]